MLPVHAPTSGVITAIELRTTAHPSGLSEMCIIIEPDGEDRWIERQPIEDFTERTPDELIEIIRQAGVSGMGGAGFPTAKKFSLDWLELKFSSLMPQSVSLILRLTTC